MNKIREAKTHEEREAMFQDLKKHPDLYKSFLKMTKKVTSKSSEIRPIFLKNF
jgi:hypothetical protein